MTATKRNKIANAILIVMSVLILVGVGLTAYFLIADKNVIKVSVDPEQTQSVSFENLSLRPGESCEYTLVLSCEYDDEYRILFDFVEGDGVQTLKNYAYVRIEDNGRTVCDELLSDAFEREDIGLGANFGDGAKYNLTVTFYIPDHIGNEAQNAEADFTLLITATNE